MKKNILLLMICCVALVKLKAQPIALNYNVSVSGSNQFYPVSSNGSFTVLFNTTAPMQIVTQEYSFSANINQFYSHTNATTYSMLNFDFIKFRIIRLDTTGTAAGTNRTNARRDTAIISFVAQQEYPSDTLNNPNFFVGSFVKSIAGTRIPENELLDLFLKVNYGPKKRWFSFIGAEAGVGALSRSNDSTNSLFRINEATANINFGFYNGFKKLDPNQVRDLKRTGFIGTGLKVFNTQPYIGAHFGVTEINGPLFGSYFFAGYYVAPYNADSTVVNTFRDNIYLEAAFNAFGDHVPSFLKSIRLKFGMMLPVGNKNQSPTNSSVLSRLAIEVPLGHVFKF